MSDDASQYYAVREALGECLASSRRLVELVQADEPADERLRRIEDAVQAALNKWDDEKFSVAILALTKSGKSTLINSLLGDEYLPAASVPETARVVRIRSGPEPGRLTSLGATAPLAVGPPQIRERLRSFNAKAREEGDRDDPEELELIAPLGFVDDSGDRSTSFELLDTPGPNEARAPHMRARVEEILTSVDVIVYLLDYTKLKTEDESKLLGLLASLRPELLGRFAERLFFAVNKIDQENRDGLTRQETQEYVSRLLERELPGLTARSNRISLVSAETGLLARLVAADRASEEALRDFRTRAFGRRGAGVTPDECRNVAPEELRHSGIPELEERMLGHIFRNRGRLLHQSLQDEMSRLLAELHNYLVTRTATLRVAHEELVMQKRRLESEFKAVTAGIESLSDSTVEQKTELEAWVRSRFSDFENSIQAEISETLHEREPPTTGVIRGLWRSFMEFFADETGDAESAASSVEKLNARILQYVELEFLRFRAELEREAHARQVAFLGDLDGRIAPLARAIEAKVSETLEISLLPVDIRIPSLSIAEMHADLGQRSETFIEKQIKARNVEMIERIKVSPGGFCSPAKFRERRVLRLRPVEEHRISRPQLQSFWRSQIEAMTEVSVATARGVLDEAFTGLVERAQGEVRDYANAFMRAISREIRESEESQHDRKEKLASAESQLRACDELRTSVRALLEGQPVGNEGDSARTDGARLIDALVVTILPEEYEAVLEQVPGHRTLVKGGWTNMHSVRIGTVGSERGRRSVAVALAGTPGNAPMSSMITSLVRDLSPRYVVLCGIAGGLDANKVARGDVVVGSSVTNFEYGKVDAGFQPRPNFTHPADVALLSAATASIALGASDYLDRVERPDGVLGERKVLTGVVLSGEKVIDDVGTPLFAAVREVWPHALAVEMEGAGAAWGIHAAHSAGINAGFLVVRGISDLPAGSGATVHAGTEARDAAKLYAARTAAAFVARLLASAWPHND